MTELERQLLLYQGMPARDAARALGITTAQVLRIWHDLKDRGLMPSTPGARPHLSQGPCMEQLSFDQIDRRLHGRRPPLEPGNPELGWTTETEGSW